MNKLIAILFLSLCHYAFAQQQQDSATIFIRVFDLEGKRISKGRIAIMSDSLLYLKKERGIITIPTSEIGKIKTKRSAGHNIFIGAVGGALIGGILAVTTNNEDDDTFFTYSDSFETAAGAMAGGILGGLGGGISSLFKNSKTTPINGDKEAWLKFKNSNTAIKE